MTGKPLCIYVGGAPKGQPRGRHVPAGKGKFRVVSTADPKIAAYRTRLIAVMKEKAKGQSWEPPMLVSVNIVAYYVTRKQHLWGHYCGKKPDRDNIDKLILDCAGAKNGAGLFKDDACVAAGSILKLWSRLGGVQIELTSLDGVMPQQDDDDDLGAQEYDLDGLKEELKHREPFGLERFLVEPAESLGGISKGPMPTWWRVH
jgi:Holliday junction resolvase RusA-like endonuclease